MAIILIYHLQAVVPPVSQGALEGQPIASFYLKKDGKNA